MFDVSHSMNGHQPFPPWDLFLMWQACFRGWKIRKTQRAMEQNNTPVDGRESSETNDLVDAALTFVDELILSFDQSGSSDGRMTEEPVGSENASGVDTAELLWKSDWQHKNEIRNRAVATPPPELLFERSKRNGLHSLPRDCREGPGSNVHSSFEIDTHGKSPLHRNNHLSSNPVTYASAQLEPSMARPSSQRDCLEQHISLAAGDTRHSTEGHGKVRLSIQASKDRWHQ